LSMGPLPKLLRSFTPSLPLWGRFSMSPLPPSFSRECSFFFFVQPHSSRLSIPSLLSLQIFCSLSPEAFRFFFSRLSPTVPFSFPLFFYPHWTTPHLGVSDNFPPPFFPVPPLFKVEPPPRDFLFFFISFRFWAAPHPFWPFLICVFFVSAHGVCFLLVPYVLSYLFFVLVCIVLGPISFFHWLFFPVCRWFFYLVAVAFAFPPSSSFPKSPPFVGL